MSSSDLNNFADREQSQEQQEEAERLNPELYAQRQHEKRERKYQQWAAQFQGVTRKTNLESGTPEDLLRRARSRLWWKYRRDRSEQRHERDPQFQVEARIVAAALQKHREIRRELYPPHSLHYQIVSDNLKATWEQMEKDFRDSSDNDQDYTLRDFVRKIVAAPDDDAADWPEFPMVYVEELVMNSDFINSDIFNAYNAAGYDWTYFGWIRRDDLRVQARNGSIDLSPATFEQGTALKSLEEYREILNEIATRPILDRSFKVITSTALPRICGWSRVRLQEALSESSLLGERVTTQGQRVPALLQRTLHLLGSEDTPRSLPGIVNRGYPYMHSLYYQAIYRKLFSTLAMVDWLAVIPREEPSLTMLVFVAQNDFDFTSEEIAGWTRAQLCQALEQKSAEKRPQMWASVVT